MSEVILRFENICKSFFGVHALQDVNIELQKGHVLGLVGENGAGKSTLMNILGGVIRADEGEMFLDGKKYIPTNPAEAAEAGVAFIHQELNLFSNLGIADNIFINTFPKRKTFPFIHKQMMRSRTQEVLQTVNLEHSPDKLVEELTPGECQLVEIARALSYDARIVIFDEPTTSLTDRETERLFDIIRQLRTEGRSIIYISHILDEIQRLTDDVAVLKDGELMGAGPTTEFSTRKMITLMVGRDIEHLYPKKTNTPGREKALELKNVSQAGIVKDISFDLHKGEIVGLFGLMGSGRSELARIIFGLDSFEQGDILINRRPRKRHSVKDSISKKLAFVTENRREEGLLMDASLFDNLALVSLPDFKKTGAVDQSRLKDALNKLTASLKIKAASLYQQAQNLSGGNQQKVVIGKWLLAEPHIFILDEPTRGVDVGAKYEVYSIVNQLAVENTAILFISSELDELMGICDRVLVMSNGEIHGNFPREQFDKKSILSAAFRESKAMTQ